MSGEGASVSRSPGGEFKIGYRPTHPYFNCETMVKVVAVAFVVIFYWATGAFFYHFGHMALPEIFLATKSQFIAASIFSASGLATGIFGLSAIAIQSSRIPKEGKIERTRRKAFKEHGVEESLEGVDFTFRSSPTLSFRHGERVEQGTRKAMEDASCYLEFEEGVLACVFDGHGGDKVAKLAAEKFPLFFPEELRNNRNNVDQAFRSTLSRIHQIVKDEEIAYQTNQLDQLENQEVRPIRVVLDHNKAEKSLPIGTTACCCFIDKVNRLYVATLGDTHIKVYRTISGKTVSIPISRKLHWGSPSEVRRAGIVARETGPSALYFTADAILNFPSVDPKGLRDLSGLNVSRALGDIRAPNVIQDPKITCMPLKDGDIVLIGCDGLWDFVHDESHFVTRVIDKHRGNPMKLANSAVQYAFRRDTDDNVSVVVIQVGITPDSEV